MSEFGQDKRKATAKELLVKEDKFRVEGIIAQGGMATVFEAKDKNCRRQVALKVVRENHKNQAEILHRFIEEAQIAAQLEHPNILPIYELSLDGNDNPYYAMKLVKGFTLEEVLLQIRIGRPEILNEYSLNSLLHIFVKICEAIDFAASKGVVHRDLKPENIMIGEFGEVLIMDWGIAKVIDPEKAQINNPRDISQLLDSMQNGEEFETSTTMQGQILGTPAYMAPEQVLSIDYNIDHRADVYALGGILYKMLSLSSPHKELSIKELLRNKVKGAIPTLAQRVKETGFKLLHLPSGKIPDALNAVCQKAMALRPDDRYQSARELRQDIVNYQNGFATQAEGATQTRLMKLLFLRHKRLSVELLLLFGLIIFYFIMSYNNLKNSHLESGMKNLNLEQLLMKEGKTEERLLRAYTAMEYLVPEAKKKITALIDSEDLLKALSITGQYLELVPDGELYALKVKILKSLGQRKMAEDVLKEGLTKFPNDEYLQALDKIE